MNTLVLIVMHFAACCLCHTVQMVVT